MTFKELQEKVAQAKAAGLHDLTPVHLTGYFTTVPVAKVETEHAGGTRLVFSPELLDHAE